MRVWRLFLQGFGAAALLGFLALAIALPFAASWLQYEDAPEKADYILPLAGDGHRVLHAAELYKQGLAPKLLLSNYALRPPSGMQKLSWELGFPRMEGYEFRNRLLEHLGVPSEAMQTFGSGHISTVEEAEALKAFIGERAVKVLLVTSPYHARRTKLVFERVLPAATFLIVASPEDRLHSRWWSDQRSALLVVGELAKLVHYWLGGVFRAAPA